MTVTGLCLGYLKTKERFFSCRDLGKVLSPAAEMILKENLLDDCFMHMSDA